MLWDSFTAKSLQAVEVEVALPVVCREAFWTADFWRGLRAGLITLRFGRVMLSFRFLPFSTGIHIWWCPCLQMCLLTTAALHAEKSGHEIFTTHYCSILKQMKKKSTEIICPFQWLKKIQKLMIWENKKEKYTVERCTRLIFSTMAANSFRRSLVP